MQVLALPDLSSFSLRLSCPFWLFNLTACPITIAPTLSPLSSLSDSLTLHIPPAMPCTHSDYSAGFIFPLAPEAMQSFNPATQGPTGGLAGVLGSSPARESAMRQAAGRGARAGTQAGREGDGSDKSKEREGKQGGGGVGGGTGEGKGRGNADETGMQAVLFSVPVVPAGEAGAETTTEPPIMFRLGAASPAGTGTGTGTGTSTAASAADASNCPSYGPALDATAGRSAGLAGGLVAGAAPTDPGAGRKGESRGFSVLQSLGLQAEEEEGLGFLSQYSPGVPLSSMPAGSVTEVVAANGAGGAYALAVYVADTCGEARGVSRSVTIRAR